MFLFMKINHKSEEAYMDNDLMFGYLWKLFK